MREQTTMKERSDIIATIVVGVILALIVVGASVLRFLETFTADGVSVAVPFRGVPAEFSPWEGLPVTTVRVTEGDVVAEGVNVLSQLSLVASIVVGALAWLAVIACFGVLALRFLKGRFFDAGNPRLLGAASWTMLGGALAIYFLDSFGIYGVLDAAGLDGYHPPSAALAPFTAIWIAAIVIGLVAIAFRRGIRLQRDTEGLV